MRDDGSIAEHRQIPEDGGYRGGERGRGDGAGDRVRGDDSAGNSGYWGRVEEFIQSRDALEARWPERDRSDAGRGDNSGEAGDRGTDPAGSWRGRGGQFLSPEQNGAVDKIIAGTRDAEVAISKDLRGVQRENASGARLAGWEFRLKGAERLKEKVAGELRIVPALAPDDAMRKVHDAVRYTFVVPTGSYARGVGELRGLLEGRGHAMVYSKNHWPDDPEYKGINTRWVSPGGQRFEVQFHTEESLHAKQEITHGAYARIRDPRTSDDERGDHSRFQRHVCSCIPAPPDVSEIADFRRRAES